MIELPKQLSVDDFNFDNGIPKLLIKKPTKEQLDAFNQFKKDIINEQKEISLTDFKL